MKRILLMASTMVMLVGPASAQGLEGLLKQVETKAKSSVFDAAVESQLPGAGALTKHLSDEQKARLFDLGVQHSGTLAQVGAATTGGLGGASKGAAGAATAATIGQILLPQARPQPQQTYQPAPSGSWGTGNRSYAPANPQYAPAPVPQRVVAPAYAPAAPRPQPTYEHIGSLD